MTSRQLDLLPSAPEAEHRWDGARRARSAAPGSSRCRCARCSTARPRRTWASGRSTRTSAASSAAPTATRGTRTATPWSGAAPPAEPMPAWEAFERRILVKTGVAEVLARTLEPARLGGHSLVIGTATDPYQPAERRFRLTRRILEVLLGFRGLAIEHHHQIAARHPGHRPAPAPGRAARGDGQHLARHAGPPARAPARAALAGARGPDPRAGAAHGGGRVRGAADGADPARHHRRPAGLESAHGRGEGSGRPLRGRVGAPARPRGAAPLPSRARPRVPRARRALRAPLRAERGREPGVSARARRPAPGAAAAATASRSTEGCKRRRQLEEQGRPGRAGGAKPLLL